MSGDQTPDQPHRPEQEAEQLSQMDEHFNLLGAFADLEETPEKLEHARRLHNVITEEVDRTGQSRDIIQARVIMEHRAAAITDGTPEEEIVNRMSNVFFFVGKVSMEQTIEAKDEVIEILETENSRLFSELTQTRVMLEDEQEKSDFWRKLAEAARTDELTKLASRAVFLLELDKALKEVNERRGQETVLLYMDLDGFKQVNDDNGHTFGDHTLRNVAETMKSAVDRESDILARVGGDEFTLIARNSGMGKAIELAKKISSNIEHLRFVNGVRVTIGVSIGVTTLRRGDTLVDIIERADRAMYKAKRDGANIELADGEEMPENLRVHDVGSKYLPPSQRFGRG